MTPSPLCLVQQTLCATALVWAMAAFARRRQWLDIPNSRSSHRRPTPRLGGAAFGPVALGGAALWLLRFPVVPASVWELLAAGTAIWALGLCDDFFDLPSGLRLSLQGIVAAGFVAAAGPAIPALGGLPRPAVLALAWLWLVGFTNAYNFMDGIDGIAAVQAVVAGAFWAIAAGGFGGPLGTVAICVLGAVIGFLPFNWPPATIFMGDAGSTLLGFLFAALPLLASGQVGGERARWLALAAGIFAVWPFVADTAVTFLARLGRGEPVWRAHRSHLYQRLAQTGLSHRTVTIVYGALAASGGVLGIVVMHSELAALGAAAGLLAGLFFALEAWQRARESRRAGSPPEY
jgi:Fuc2NAc and GlcNAc transferase